jgi:hypothetical protein
VVVIEDLISTGKSSLSAVKVSGKLAVTFWGRWQFLLMNSDRLPKDLPGKDANLIL